MTVAEWRATHPTHELQIIAKLRQVLALASNPGAAIALAAGLLFTIAGAATMLASMPDGLRGSFIGAVFATVGVLLGCYGASLHTDTEGD